MPPSGEARNHDLRNQDPRTETNATSSRDTGDSHKKSSTSTVAKGQNGFDHQQNGGPENDAGYRALLDLCPSMMWVCDDQGRTIYSNAEWQKYSRSTAQESDNESWLSQVHPEDRARISAELQSAEPAPFEHELRLSRSDGQYRWHIAKAVPISAESRQGGRWLGTCVDIHDRKMALAAVAEAEEHMRFTLEAAGVGSCGFYPCSEKKEWSGRSADMLGVPRDLEPKLEIFMSRIHPDDRQRVWETVGALLQSPVSGEYDFDYRIVRPDGEIRWLLSRGKYYVPPVGSGEEPRMKGILLDITERKQAEEEKKRLEEELLLAHKMEAIGRLASGVSHDFNNLITVIAGAADRLEKKLIDQPGAPDLLKIIHEAAEHASGLTGQLLAFGRRQVLHPVSLNLNEILSQLKSMLQGMVGEDIAVETRQQQDLWNVKIDPVQLEQILLNLAANARDAMPQGGTITITTGNQTIAPGSNGDHNVVKPGEYVSLRFSDTGVGMDAELLTHLFEPFYTTKQFGQGTGLGLATVYGIVQQSAGHISVRSAPGQGTEFTVYLPRTREAVMPAVQKGNDSREQEVLHCPSQPVRVLLVEDEGSLRALLAEHLSEHGYQVHEAANACEAQEIAARAQIDLLITDLIMPGPSGLSISQSLAETRPALRTIFISGYAENEALHAALQRPNTFYLQKPFRVLNLLAKIREVLPSGEEAGSTRRSA